MTAPHEFAGFPAEGLHFLRDLRHNNHKEWFTAHKSVYQNAVQAPAVALVATLGERLRQYFPRITYDTRTNGAGSLMRIYRDTRFSADKTPYKTNIAMMFTADARKRMEQPGFGLQLSADHIELVAGIFQFSKPQLEAYRAAVLDEKRGAALVSSVEQVTTPIGYTTGGETYKRVPSSYDAHHPRAAWLKFSGLHVLAPPLPVEVAQTSALVDQAATHFVHMAPIVQWLEAVFNTMDLPTP
jgi:uncharacterized protein (TIGR02453 family)